MVDSKLDQVAGLEVGLRVHSHADPGRRARGNDVPGEKGHEPADVAEKKRYLEVKVGGVARLNGLSIHLQPHAEVVGVGYFVRGC